MWLTAVQTRKQIQDSQQSSESHEALPQPARTPVSEPALYGPHEAEHLSLLPELHEAYLQDPMFGDPSSGRLRRHFVAENGVWYRGTVIAVPSGPSLSAKFSQSCMIACMHGTVESTRRCSW